MGEIYAFDCSLNPWNSYGVVDSVACKVNVLTGKR